MKPNRLNIPNRIPLPKHLFLRESGTRLHIGCFLAGLFLGPIGILFASADKSRKGSLRSAVDGWFLGWVIIIVMGALYIFIQDIQDKLEFARFERKLAREQEREVAAQMQIKVREREENSLKEKQKMIRSFNKVLQDIETDKEWINGVLYGEVYDGFDKEDIRRYSPNTSLMDEFLGQKIVAVEITENNSTDEINEASSIANKELKRVKGRRGEIEGIYLKLMKDKGEAEAKKRAEEATKELESRKEDCPKCNRLGKIKCTRCNGRGLVSTTITTECLQCSGAGEVNKLVECPRCNGFGKIRPKCWACNGKGKVKNTDRTRIDMHVRCSSCNGSGRNPPETCPNCYGEKKIDNKEACAKCSGKGSIFKIHNVDCPDCKGKKKLMCEHCDGKGFWYR